MAMGTCSREYKRAVMRNTAAGGNLQNSLDSLEDQKKRLVRSFEEKKLNFIEKKGTLPKLFSSLGQTEEWSAANVVNSRNSFQIVQR